MKKIIFTSLIMLFTTSLIFSQDIADEATKMDNFVSKTGVVIKFIDSNLQDLKLNYGVAETKIRRIITGEEIAYFYQISKTGQYDTKTASIAEEDLGEVIKALSSLKEDFQTDSRSNPDYLENKFKTEDGFQLGYYVSGKQTSWYLVLEKYGSENTIFIKDVSTIESAFNIASSTIEYLKEQNTVN